MSSTTPAPTVPEIKEELIKLFFAWIRSTLFDDTTAPTPVPPTPTPVPPTPTPTTKKYYLNQTPDANNQIDDANGKRVDADSIDTNGEPLALLKYYNDQTPDANNQIKDAHGNLVDADSIDENGLPWTDEPVVPPTPRAAAAARHAARLAGKTVPAGPTSAKNRPPIPNPK